MWAPSPTGCNMRCGAGLGGGVRTPRPYGDIVGDVGKESPSHGFAVPAPFRQGGRGDGGCGLPRARCALAMTLLLQEGRYGIGGRTEASAPTGALLVVRRGRGSLAHRRANRLTGTVVPANRGTSSKPARFIRHWRRFADFPSRGRGRTPPLRKRCKGCRGVFFA